MKKIIYLILLIVFASPITGWAQSKTITAPGTYTFSTIHSFNATKYIKDMGEGTVKYIESYTNDEKGNITRKEIDRDEDGIPDVIEIFTFNANGKLIKEEIDDGYPNHKLVTIFAYNIQGKLIKSEVFRGGASNPDIITINTYDARGNITRIEEDTNGDGIPNYIGTFTYDGRGNMIRSDRANGDGIPKFIAIYTYDARGNKTRQEYDNYGDGTSIYVETYTYDTNGNMTRMEQDFNGNGIIDFIETYTYDAMGNKTGSKRDYDGNGVLEIFEINTYNAKGIIIREETYDYGNTTPYQVIIYTYDKDGNLTKYERNSETINYTYDSNGNRIKIEYDYSGDGLPDEVVTLQYINKATCTNLGNGLAHKLMVKVEDPGNYKVGLCGSSFQNIMVLSATGPCDSTIKFSESGCPSGDAQFHASLDTGTYYLTIVGVGITDKGNYILNLEKVGELSINTLANKKLLTYPNPAANTVTIKNLNNNNTGYYTIYNAIGQEIMTIKATETIDISSLDAGIYFIHATTSTNKEIMTGKFIKL